MILSVKKALVLASSMVAFALPGFADDIQQQDPQQQQQADLPTVLIVRVALDESGQEIRGDAVLVPMKVKLHRGKTSVDTDQLVRDCDAAMDSAETISLAADQFDEATLPEAVRMIFDRANQGIGNKDASWRFWSPWGSVGNNGYFGYGRYNNWGYNPNYTNYYPSYGYYYSGYPYSYNFGYYRPFNNYGYYYYWR